jgi:hypothetical protein
MERLQVNAELRSQNAEWQPKSKKGRSCGLCGLSGFFFLFFFLLPSAF